VAPHVLIDAEDPDAVEPALVVDEDSLAFGKDRVVGGVPRDAEPFGDPSNGEGAARRIPRLLHTATDVSW